MKKLSTLFLLLILIGCSKSEFNVEERNEDISSIINSVLNKNNIDVSKDNVDNNKIVQFLRKVKIVIPNPDKNIITPPDRNEIEINQLLDFEFKKYFNKNDSLYLLSQNINPDSLEINKVLKERYNYSELSKISNHRNKRNYYQYYEFTIPLFSKDRKRLILN